MIKSYDTLNAEFTKKRRCINQSQHNHKFMYQSTNWYVCRGYYQVKLIMQFKIENKLTKKNQYQMFL